MRAFAVFLWWTSLVEAAERPDLQPTGERKHIKARAALLETAQEEEPPSPSPALRVISRRVGKVLMQSAVGSTANVQDLNMVFMRKGGRRRAPPPRRRTPHPTPYPTPRPTPSPTPAPTYPTPYPTPGPTPPPTRIPTPNPTPGPTPAYMHPEADIPEDKKAVYRVVDMLNHVLKDAEKMLRAGSNEDRLGWCEQMHKDLETCKTDHAFVDQEPHKWALGEVARELDWLCINWSVDKKEQMPQHYQMMQEVLEMYEERLTCMPGDVYCSPQGRVGGIKPDCHCVCNHGWTGEACHERGEQRIERQPLMAR